MKKRLMNLGVLALFISLSLAAQAQFGFRAGLNLANETFSALGVSANASSKLGFHAGPFYEASLSDAVFLRPAALYSGKGAKIEDVNGMEVSMSTSYVEIPIDLVYKLDAGSNKVALHAGPYLGVLLSADTEGEDVKDELKSTDFGINIGGSFELEQIGIGINYGFGLSDISEIEVDPIFGEPISVKNKVLSFFVTYRF